MKNQSKNIEEQFSISGGALESIVKTMTILGDIVRKFLRNTTLNQLIKTSPIP